MMTSETHITVRYAETDRMGIVHHSNYPVWFEAARTEFIKNMGMPYSKMEEMGFLLPLIELKCAYKGAAKYEDEVTVRTTLKEITNTRVIFFYEVYKNGEPNIITTGETVHVWTDKNLRPLNIKKHSPEIYQLISSAI
ncbi:MAG: acyl-CoA thioesterase [Clostridia bacterium]|nr:acyl-CoA thioesterase [Clostridia bacterium]